MFQLQRLLTACVTDWTIFYVGFQRRNLPIEHRRPSNTATALCRHVQHRTKWGNPSAQSERYRDCRIHVSTCVQKVFHIKGREESKKTHGEIARFFSRLTPCRLIHASFQWLSSPFILLRPKIVTLINSRRNNCPVTRVIKLTSSITVDGSGEPGKNNALRSFSRGEK